MPAIVRQARHAFRGLPAEAREDAIQEVVANCLVAFVRLAELGKVELAYPSALARYAVAQFRAGRRVGNSWRLRDAYSAHGPSLQHIGSPRDQRHGWREQLVDSRAMSVPDLAAFRIDFPAWLATLTDRDRWVALQLGNGERTMDVASRFGLSCGRVSQLRHEMERSWHEFHGELDDGSSKSDPGGDTGDPAITVHSEMVA